MGGRDVSAGLERSLAGSDASSEGTDKAVHVRLVRVDQAVAQLENLQ